MSALLKLHKIFSPNFLFVLLSGIFLLFAGLAVAFDQLLLIFIPFFFLLVLVCILDFRILYYLLIICIPITIEIYLPNGLGIDLPAELLLMGITALSPLLFINRFRKEHLKILLHPISLGLGFHIFWILISGVLAADMVVGLKFFIAKFWYIIPFFFMSIFMFKNEKAYDRFFWSLLIPLGISILYVLTKHASLGFSFSEVNSAVSPIYRNHVNYGLLMVCFLPYIWAFYKKSEQDKTKQNFLFLVGGLCLVAIYFTYTRAAQLSVLIGVGAYFIVKFRLIKHVLLTGSIVVIFLAGFLISNNRYLDFAPQYEKTITHENYDNLLEATVKLEDISTMERVNRWIAGYQMVVDRPFSGFGPGNFYFNYKDYMVSSFVTYVSDNPDKSGIHNYYLMTMVEQGIVGFLIFMTFLFIAFIYGEQLYHKVEDKRYKPLIMAALISLIIIATVITINDLLEALKIGALFFISLAILVREGIRYDQQKKLT